MGFHTRLVWALGMGRGDVLEVSASTAFDDRIVTDCASGHENRNGAWRRELRHPVRPVKNGKVEWTEPAGADWLALIRLMLAKLAWPSALGSACSSLGCAKLL